MKNNLPAVALVVPVCVLTWSSESVIIHRHTMIFEEFNTLVKTTFLNVVAAISNLQLSTLLIQSLFFRTGSTWGLAQRVPCTQAQARAHLSQCWVFF